MKRRVSFLEITIGLCILCNLILNYGFTALSIPIGIPLPLSEAVLVAYLVVGVSFGTMPQNSLRMFAVIVAVAVMPGSIHLVRQLPEYKVDAARDFLSVIDLLFIVAGISVADALVRAQRLEAALLKFTRAWLLLGTAYLLTMPFAETVRSISPAGTGLDKVIPILGFYLTGPLIAATGLLSIVVAGPGFLFGKRVAGKVITLTLCGFWFYVLAVGQGRGILGALFLCIPVLIVLRRFGMASRLLGAFLGAVLLIVAVPLLGIDLQGRVGQVDIGTYANRFSSIFGAGEDLSGIDGVLQRLQWWGDALRLWGEDLGTVIFGIGYGPALTDFYTPTGALVREPHNSYITSLVRGGVFYFAVWGGLVWMAIRSARRVARVQGELGQLGLLYMLLLFVMLVVAAVQPLFETPSLAAIFYFFGGVFVRIAREGCLQARVAPSAGRPVLYRSGHA